MVIAVHMHFICLSVCVFVDVLCGTICVNDRRRWSRKESISGCEIHLFAQMRSNWSACGRALVCMRNYCKFTTPSHRWGEQIESKQIKCINIFRRTLNSLPIPWTWPQKAQGRLQKLKKQMKIFACFFTVFFLLFSLLILLSFRAQQIEHLFL